MKAVIPAAGLGIRFLPYTKAQPKEMLPVLDKPAIQYVVEEAAASGIEDIVVVTARGKRAIEDHFDIAPELEQMLKRKADHRQAFELHGAIDNVDIYYIRQKSPEGLGHAVWCARKHVGNESFALLLSDDILIGDSPCTRQLIDIYKKRKKSVIAVERVPKEKANQYGIVDCEKIETNLHKVNDLIEKPDIGKAPSNLAILGRYILTPRIFDCIEKIKPGIHGEIQLTDALRLLREEEEIFAYEFTGRRYDIGNKIEWLKATMDFAFERKDIGDELRNWLSSRLEK
jgi:UTP--glucose-1-phosphate uridylyltransferase